MPAAATLLSTVPANGRARGGWALAVLAGHVLLMALALQGGAGVDRRLLPAAASSGERATALVYLQPPTMPPRVAALATVSTARALASTRPMAAAQAHPVSQSTVPAVADAGAHLQAVPDAGAAPFLAAAAAAASAVVAHAEPVFTAPRALAANRPPDYPDAAREDGLHGAVQLRLLIDAAGRVTDVAWLRRSGVALLDHAARDALRAWRFEPARRGGEPVAAALVLTVRFELDGPVQTRVASIES